MLTALFSTDSCNFYGRNHIHQTNLLSMKRILLVLLSSFFFAAASFAQLRVGILGGGHQSEILETNDLPNWNTIKNNYSPRIGGHFGFIADLPFGKKASFCFQPGVIFYAKGRKYAEIMDTTIHDTLKINSTEYLNYIEVPFNLIVKMNLGKKVKFILGAGTYLSFFYNGNLKTETVSKQGVYGATEINDPEVGDGPGKYSTFDFGVNGLAGFEFGRVFLTANYSRGLNNFYQSPTYNGRFKHQVMGATLGVFIGRPVKMINKDKDGDGVPDKNDKCPDVKGSALLDGCPDKDSDGIADKDDECPQAWGPSENKGCPYQDKDGDGVLDKDDKCPAVAGSKDNNGCPYTDTDKDGIVDKDDKCPTVAGLSRYSGCPVPDSDGDGVNDEVDKCPNVKGLIENSGCPEIKKEIVEKVNYAAKRIQFKFAKTDILSESFKVLNEIADLLKQNPELKLSIEGHTSSDGIREVNIKLSKERANNVKKYLVSKDIDASRLTTVGYGPDRPLSTGKTEAEKAKNRRVELKLSNQ